VHSLAAPTFAVEVEAGIEDDAVAVAEFVHQPQATSEIGTEFAGQPVAEPLQVLVLPMAALAVLPVWPVQQAMQSLVPEADET
jgi:hypothetical protein